MISLVVMLAEHSVDSAHAFLPLKVRDKKVKGQPSCLSLDSGLHVSGKVHRVQALSKAVFACAVNNLWWGLLHCMSCNAGCTHVKLFFTSMERSRGLTVCGRLSGC